MTYKFKIGDEVQIIDECKEFNWYHTRPMKIIGINRFYYFTDYWKIRGYHSNYDFENDLSNGITEECLEYSNSFNRNKKLNRIFNI
jgi:hypothetical protein